MARPAGSWQRSSPRLHIMLSRAHTCWYAELQPSRPRSPPFASSRDSASRRARSIRATSTVTVGTLCPLGHVARRIQTVLRQVLRCRAVLLRSGPLHRLAGSSSTLDCKLRQRERFGATDELGVPPDVGVRLTQPL